MCENNIAEVIYHMGKSLDKLTNLKKLSVEINADEGTVANLMSDLKQNIKRKVDIEVKKKVLGQ